MLSGMTEAKAPASRSECAVSTYERSRPGLYTAGESRMPRHKSYFVAVGAGLSCRYRARFRSLSAQPIVIIMTGSPAPRRWDSTPRFVQCSLQNGPHWFPYMYFHAVS